MFASITHACWRNRIARVKRRAGSPTNQVARRIADTHGAEINDGAGRHRGRSRLPEWMSPFLIPDRGRATNDTGAAALSPISLTVGPSISSRRGFHELTVTRRQQGKTQPRYSFCGPLGRSRLWQPAPLAAPAGEGKPILAASFS